MDSNKCNQFHLFFKLTTLSKLIQRYSTYEFESSIKACFEYINKLMKILFSYFYFFL